MIIAIPSVTNYISDSRKSSYIDTAKELINGARTTVNEGKLEMYNTDSTYYIPGKCIATENSLRSPYGSFTETYIGVIYDGKGYKYYWISNDEAGQGIKNITSLENLANDLIESDVTDIEILNTVQSTGIGNRSEVLILKDDCKTWNDASVATNHVDEENVVVYPKGKTKATVETGEIVKIKDEEFYVVKRDGDDLVLIAHYNLKIGGIYGGVSGNWSKIGEYATTDTGYGLQSSDVKGWLQGVNSSNGALTFSNTNYWKGKVGSIYSNSYCTNINGKNCTYVYDSNSNLYQYVQNYKTYLGNIVKEARLMTLEEATLFQSINQTAWKETSYWLGSPYNGNRVWRVLSDGHYGYSYYDDLMACGIRPVIII